MYVDTAFLDMDGILADFVGAVCKAHGRTDPYLDPSSHGIFEMEKLWGITAAEFWAPADTHEFWANIPKMPDADGLVQCTINSFGEENICILTAPSNSPGCISGKRAWMKQHYPQFKKRMIFATAKHFIAGPGKFLIDDRDENIEAWIKAGGFGLLVPRPWNKLHEEV